MVMIVARSWNSEDLQSSRSGALTGEDPRCFENFLLANVGSGDLLLRFDWSPSAGARPI